MGALVSALDRRRLGLHDDRHRIGLLVAYYELGWGGWWFWDPVENALPHALAVWHRIDPRTHGDR